MLKRYTRLAERGFATAGNRVLLTEGITRAIEAGQVDPLDWSLRAWLRAWLRGDVNRPWGLLRLPGQAWRRMRGQPWRLFKLAMLHYGGMTSPA